MYSIHHIVWSLTHLLVSFKSGISNFQKILKYTLFSVRTDLLVNGAQSRLHIAGATYTDSGETWWW